MPTNQGPYVPNAQTPYGFPIHSAQELRARVALLLAIFVGVIGTIACLGEEAPLLLATAQELLEYPSPLSTEQTPLVERLFIVELPQTNLVVILRPISESEYGSFQVQSIDAQMIDLQILAAAIVLPAVTPSDVAAFPAQLQMRLRQAVNRISGFAVFDESALP